MTAPLITDDLLENWRLKGELVRVIRDVNIENDVIGLVAAWNDQQLLIRKRNKKVVELARSYYIQSASAERKVDGWL